LKQISDGRGVLPAATRASSPPNPGAEKIALAQVNVRWEAVYGRL